MNWIRIDTNLQFVSMNTYYKVHVMHRNLFPDLRRDKLIIQFFNWALLTSTYPKHNEASHSGETQICYYVDGGVWLDKLLGHLKTG